MGDVDGKMPGKRSGVTADDFAAASNHGGLAPGKRNLIQQMTVGNQWIDHDAVCDGKDDATAGCFLQDMQRLKLIIDFKLRVVVAQGNYKLALEQLRVAELMKKDEDLNWALSLALDVVGAHFVGVAAKALKSAKASGIARLDGLAAVAGITGEYNDHAWTSRAERLLYAINDKSIETYTKAGLDPIKRIASKKVQGAMNADDGSEKAASLSYIDQLTNGCDIGFQKFADHVAGSTNDAELVVYWEGMDPINHTVAGYKSALAEKLARFKKSGVNDVGRKQGHDRETGDASVQTDTRVVWVKEMSGNKSLWYQSQEGDYDPSVIKPGDPASESFYPDYARSPHPFGPSDPRGAARLDRRVPEEFQEAAIAKSEQLWGETPTIEDPATTLHRSWGVDPQSKPPAPIASMSAPPQAQIPAPTQPLPRLDLRPTLADPSILSVNKPFGTSSP